MNQDFSSFVERYQLIYEKDPDSKVFAPLAEAYRRMGLLEEAIDVAERGVKRHPNFASGRVALGKCYAQRGDHAKAVEQLEVAVELSPENLLAHQLITECYLKLGRVPEALSASKMVLFLNPQDVKAAETVKKLEEQIFAQSQGEWAGEDFSMERLEDVAAKADAIGLTSPQQSTSEDPQKATFPASVERELALLDARIDRGDWEQVQNQIQYLIEKYPNHPEIQARRQHLDELTQDLFDVGEWISPMETAANQKKIQTLEDLLDRIQKKTKHTR